MTYDLRIVSVNDADEATITATDVAPTLGVDNLKTDIKGKVCRILDNEGTITLKWSDTRGFDCVALPAWNGSASSEIKVEIFDDTDAGNLVWDSGWLWAAPGPALEYWDFSQPLNVNSFEEGCTVTAVWVPNIPGKRIEINLKDPNNAFLDISRIIAGTTFYTCGASYGSNIGVKDNSSFSRTAGGDIRIDKKTKRRSNLLNLAGVPTKDRHQLARIIQGGIGKRHFFSGYTNADDEGLRQELMMYGVVTNAPTLTIEDYQNNNTQLQIEEW